MKRIAQCRGTKSALAAALAIAIAAPVSAQDVRYRFPKQMTMSPKGVNLQTGRFSYSKTDLSIGPLKLTRTWGESPAISANGRSMGPLWTYTSDTIQAGQWAAPNAGWSHNFNQGVLHLNSGSGLQAYVYVVIDGQQYKFGELADTAIIPADQGAQGTQLVLSSGQWTFTDKGGARYVFFAHPAMPQGAPTGLNQLLQSATYADGTRIDYSYDAGGRPEFIKSSVGYAIGLEYDGYGNVSAACGFNLAMVNADASTPCSSTSLRVTYSYDGAGTKLASVTDSDNHVVTHSYGATTITPLLTCVSLPDSPTCEIQNTYGPAPGAPFNYDDQVRVQTTASNAIWSYSFRPAPDPQDEPVIIGLPRYSVASMTDPSGAAYGFRYDRGHLVEANMPTTLPNGLPSVALTRYRYAYIKGDVYTYAVLPTPVEYHDVKPRLVTSPEGNSEYIFHDARGNVTTHSYWPKGSPNPASTGDPNLETCCTIAGNATMPAGASTFLQTFLPDAGVVTYYGIPLVLGCGSGAADAKLCDKPLTRTDARGGLTEFTYAPEHGGVLTETGPAGADGIRPQTRYAYVQRQAWVKDAGGGYVQTGQPIWLLARKSSCRTTAALGNGCAGGPSDELVTLYDYGPEAGPNNLLLRGQVDDANGAALRSCFAYDAIGNRISETKPRAGLAACP